MVKKFETILVLIAFIGGFVYFGARFFEPDAEEIREETSVVAEKSVKTPSNADDTSSVTAPAVRKVKIIYTNPIGDRMKEIAPVEMTTMLNGSIMLEATDNFVLTNILVYACEYNADGSINENQTTCYNIVDEIDFDEGDVPAGTMCYLDKKYEKAGRYSYELDLASYAADKGIIIFLGELPIPSQSALQFH